MASSQPITRQVKLLPLIPQLLFMGLIILIFYLFQSSDPLLYGLVTYLIIFIVIRNIIPLNHRNGIRLYKTREYQKAILEFEKSYSFFEKHSWIDRYRYIVLLSSSRISYLEMALINMAFCYSQIGNGLKSKELYEKTLNMFPDSQIAKTALKMFESAKEIS
jgi:tetratricopeptide (TPR) repeat protein